MRVASNQFSDSLLRQLNVLNNRQARLQSQASSGQRLTTPEDDPAAAQRALALAATGARASQFLDNISAQKDLATASLTGIRALKRINDRASEIATLADGTKSPDELKAFSVEVDQLLRQALQTANTRYNGHPLFAGTRLDQTAFTEQKNADGLITAVNYNGDSSQAESSIGEGQRLSTQAIGANSGATGPAGLLADSRNGADLFAHLISLRDHLSAGDTTAIVNTDRPQLGKDEDNLIYHIGLNGALQARLEAASSSATTERESADQAVSRDTSADLAETLMQLNQTNNAYQAALQSAGSLLRLSLMDYLR